METTTNDHETRIDWLEQKVRYDLSAKIDAMSWGIGQIHTSHESTRADQAGLRAGLAHLESTTHTDMTAIKATLDARASELREKIGGTEASVRADLTSFRNAVGDRFEQAGMRFDKVDAQLGELKQWTAGADERFASIDQRFAIVDRHFDVVNKRFDGVDERFDGVNRRLDSVDQRLDSVDQRFDGMDQRFDELSAKLDRVLASVPGEQDERS